MCIIRRVCSAPQRDSMLLCHYINVCWYWDRIMILLYVVVFAVDRNGIPGGQGKRRVRSDEQAWHSWCQNIVIVCFIIIGVFLLLHISMYYLRYDKVRQGKVGSGKAGERWYCLRRWGATCSLKGVSRETPDVAPCRTSPPMPFGFRTSLARNAWCNTMSPQGVFCCAVPVCPVLSSRVIRPISLLILSLLRLLDSKLLGNSLWTWPFRPFNLRFCLNEILWSPES